MYNAQAVFNRTAGVKNAALADCHWPDDALNFIPDWAYTSN